MTHTTRTQEAQWCPGKCHLRGDGRWLYKPVYSMFPVVSREHHVTKLPKPVERTSTASIKTTTVANHGFIKLGKSLKNAETRLKQVKVPVSLNPLKLMTAMRGSQSLLPASSNGECRLLLMNSRRFGGPDTVRQIITGYIVVEPLPPWLLLFHVQNHESPQGETKLLKA